MTNISASQCSSQREEAKNCTEGVGRTRWMWGICNLSIAEARPLIREEEVEMGHNNDGDSKHL